MRSPAKTESPTASFRAGAPGACALTWSPWTRDTRPTDGGAAASTTAVNSNRPRAIRLMPTECSLIQCLPWQTLRVTGRIKPLPVIHSAHENQPSAVRAPAVRHAVRHGGSHHRDHRHPYAGAILRQFHFHGIERHRHYPSRAGPWLLSRRLAGRPQAVDCVVFLTDRGRRLFGAAAAAPQCHPAAGHRLPAVPG